jgi:hypothetical protein
MRGDWVQRLNSVKLKIARAKEHLAQVQKEIDAWLKEGGSPWREKSAL